MLIWRGVVKATELYADMECGVSLDKILGGIGVFDRSRYVYLLLGRRYRADVSGTLLGGVPTLRERLERIGLQHPAPPHHRERGEVGW